MANTVCPSEVALREYLLGLVHEQDIARYTAHLDECAFCLERVQRLAANDWLLDSLSSPGVRDLVQHWTDEELIKRLRWRGVPTPEFYDDTSRTRDSVRARPRDSGRVDSGCQDLYDAQFLAGSTTPSTLGD